jgi:hypothetical protein
MSKFLKSHSNVNHFEELEKIHCTFFGVFKNISYFQSFRCFNKRYPKNLKLENFYEPKGY